MTAWAQPRVDAVVLAGGTSTRFGGDKLAVLLDQVLAGLPPQVAVVCVGPARPTVRSPVTWVREDPPLSGPLAAVAAGVAAGDGPVVVVVGGDMPRVGAAVGALLAALETTGDRPAGGGPVDGAVLVDGDGAVQLLASAWHRDRLVGRLADLAGEAAPGTRPSGSAAGSGLAGVPLRLLGRGARLVEVTDLWGAGRDVDTPADLW